MTDIERQAREAALDHGMWLAPDDDETNYQAFVAGYLRGYSDRGVESTTARDEYEKEISTLRARVAELDGMVPRWVSEEDFLDPSLDGWEEVTVDEDTDLILACMVPPIPLPGAEG